MASPAMSFFFNNIEKFLQNSAASPFRKPQSSAIFLDYVCFCECHAVPLMIAKFFYNTLCYGLGKNLYHTSQNVRTIHVDDAREGPDKNDLGFCLRNETFTGCVCKCNRYNSGNYKPASNLLLCEILQRLEHLERSDELEKTR